MTAVGHVWCTIWVNGVLSPEHPADYELRQRWGKHDLFFLRLVVPKGREASLLTAWPDGAAVQVQWGRLPGAGISTWYGYIHHHDITTSDDLAGQDVQITYVLIGTSGIMQGDKNQVWQQYTPTAIAQKIARQYALRCVVTQTSWVLPYEIQAHEPDFAFLQRIADKTGFRCWVSGGTLYFIDPIVLLAGQTTNNTPTYTVNKQSYLMDPAKDFRVLQGTMLPGGYSQMTRTIFGIDVHAIGHPVFQVNATPAPSQTDFIVNTTRHAESRAYAKQIQDAQQGLSQFWILASAEVLGNVLLYPGKAVNLYGTAIADKNNGAWIVTSASHTGRLSGSPDATTDSFTTRLTIMTNQKSNIPYIKGIQQVVPEIVSCNLAGGKWQSASLNVVIEGIV